MKLLTRSFFAIAMMFAGSAAFAQQNPVALPNITLPNNASSISEQYNDWTVNCGIQNNNRICEMVQVQVTQQGQTIFRVGLLVGENGTLNGTVVLPLGLLVTQPMKLRIDEGADTFEAPIRTCLPGGCLMPVEFNQQFASALRAGSVLTIQGVSFQEEEITLSVSLNGFSSAMDRMANLMQ